MRGCSCVQRRVWVDRDWLDLGEARQTAGSGISSDSRADVDGKEEVESEGMLLLRNRRRHGRRMDELGEPDRRL